LYPPICDSSKSECAHTQRLAARDKIRLRLLYHYNSLAVERERGSNRGAAEKKKKNRVQRTCENFLSTRLAPALICHANFRQRKNPLTVTAWKIASNISYPSIWNEFLFFCESGIPG